MSWRRERRSLKWELAVSLAIGELALAVVLVLTVGTFSLINVAQQRAQTIRDVGAVIAAAMMPLVADQQASQVQAQMESVLRTTEVNDIQSIRVVDSSGQVIASQGVETSSMTSQVGASRTPLEVLTEPQVVRQPVVVDGMTVATAYVTFAPQGLIPALRTPAIAVALVLASMLLVSLPWSAWRFTRVVIEPLGKLGRYASRIADGELDERMDTGAVGEIAELEAVLNRMAEQLKFRQDQLTASYDELAEAYDALQSAKQEIEQLAALKTDFVAVAAHEIRSPLAAITLYTELLEAGEITELDDAGALAIAAIHSAASRLNYIASDLMDSALLERGMLSISFAEVSLDEILLGAMRDAEVTARARGMEVEIDGTLPQMTVVGDELRLRQVFDNLLSNALKYSADGAGVTLRAKCLDEWITVDVIDQGRGIPPEDRERIFELFVKLDVADSRDTAGLGLGLAISSRIVGAHGGSITVRDNPDGCGSVLSVKLPISSSLGDLRERTTVSVVREEGNT